MHFIQYSRADSRCITPVHGWPFKDYGLDLVSSLFTLSSRCSARAKGVLLSGHGVGDRVRARSSTSANIVRCVLLVSRAQTSVPVPREKNSKGVDDLKK